MTISLIDTVVPLGTFPIVRDTDLFGGMRAVADNTERDAIPTLDRKAGMLVWSQIPGVLYLLGPGLTNGDWVVFGSSAITSTTPGNDVSASTANNGAGDAGDVLLDPGDSTAGVGGSIIGTGGDGTTAGGGIDFTGGNASAGNGGSITQTGGTGSVDGGDIVLVGGDGTTGDGGSIIVTPGSGGTNQGTVDLVPPAGGTAVELRFYEDPVNGTEYVAVKAPASIPLSWTFTWPDNDGNAGQFLQTDGSGNTTWANAGGGGSVFRQSFVNADLTAGVLTVNHVLGTQFNQVTVYDNNDQIIDPDLVTATDANNTAITLSTYQAANGGAIPGTWNVVVNG